MTELDDEISKLISNLESIGKLIHVAENFAPNSRLFTEFLTEIRSLNKTFDDIRNKLK